MNIPTARNQFLFNCPAQEVEVWVKRLDELHPMALGNKLFKLKYNFQRAHKLGFSTLITFGGAYSNHIVATAVLGKAMRFRSIGVIRGEELGKDLQKTLAENPTLRQAHAYGMRFHFVSRSAYKEKNETAFQQRLQTIFGPAFILPEGGTNVWAVKGCSEILTEEDRRFDLICCAVGTGGTLSGLVNAASEKQSVWGFSALRADLTKEVMPYVKSCNWKIFTEDNFGGFAKINVELVGFINRFAQIHHLPLDPVYNAKMMYGLLKKIKAGEVRRGSRILVIHSGGLQGIKGMNAKLTRKNMPVIELYK